MAVRAFGTPLVKVSLAMVPVPPLALKVTLYVAGFAVQIAYRVSLPETVMVSWSEKTTDPPELVAQPAKV